MFSYDSADELLGIDSSKSGSTAGFTHYTYSANGLRASLTNPDGTTIYGYDVDGQLTSASYPAGSGLAGESFSYDPIGDQTQASQAYDGAGRLTSDTTYSYTYDKEGDLTSRTNIATGRVTTYSWNAAHQLLAVTAPDGSQTSFGYDPLGRRVDVTTASGRVHTVYNGTQPIASYDVTGGLTASYVYGAGQNDQLEETLPGGGSYFYLHDALGSVTALTDGSGSAVDSYRYTAFGQTHATGSVPNPFTYIGAPTDPSTGLVYLNARYLDPTTGRFISEDPVPAPALYPYANDDPINLSDPTGRISADDELEAEAIGEQVDNELQKVVGQELQSVAKEGSTELQTLLKTFDPDNPDSALGRIALGRDDLTKLWDSFQATVVKVTQGPVVRSPQAAGDRLGLPNCFRRACRQGHRHVRVSSSELGDGD